MNPWIPKAVFLVAFTVMSGIRIGPNLRSRRVPVAKSRIGRREIILSALVGLGVAAPLIWVGTPALAFADHQLTSGALIVGTACFAAGLWLLYRSHADLGTNWSSMLQVRDHHRLITDGVYRRVRHPMYSAFLLYAFGQLLVVSNWVAGSSCLVTFVLLIASRVPDEERMMLEEFGEEYAAYTAKTTRLLPGI